MPIVVTQVPTSVFYVNHDAGSVNLVGTPTAPFQTMAQAVAAAAVAGKNQVVIKVAAGNYSAQDFTLLQNINWLIEGPVSGYVLLGNISWQVSGGGVPLPTSVLFLRNVGPKSIAVSDGPGGAAARALLILENCAVLGNITQTGTSVVTTQIAGISTASSAVAGANVSSVVTGNIAMPVSSLGLTNTQVGGSITGTLVWARGCQIAGSITSTGAVEVNSSWVTGLITTTALTIDEYSYARGASFDGSPVTFVTSAHTWRKYTYTFSQFTVGTITKTLLNLPVKAMIHNVIVKTSIAWLGITMKVSVGITGTVNKYVNGFNCVTAVSDANFTQPAGGAAAAPFSWVNTTPILLTATVGAGVATAGSVDIWIETSQLL